MAIKVLVVDDSALMRRYLTGILENTRGMEPATARNGKDALTQIAAFDPDVVTLDINMPVMDGLTCLSHIMTDFPRPVVMVSSLTEAGALATFEALEMGAVDYLPKPGGTVSLNIKEVADELIDKVRAAARSRIRRSSRPHPRPSAQSGSPPPRHRSPARPRTAPTNGPTVSEGLVLIGASTGGPQAVEAVISQLGTDFPWPVVVAQHMPHRFTSVFARRLDETCALDVGEVTHPTPLEPGAVLIGQGDADLKLGRRGTHTVALSVPESDRFVWHPSVERMVRSALDVMEPDRLIAVQLTGMGYDGAEAMAELHQRGGRVIAESEETAVVYGMPREVVERGGADVVLPVEEIAAQLHDWVGVGQGQPA